MVPEDAPLVSGMWTIEADGMTFPSIAVTAVLLMAWLGRPLALTFWLTVCTVDTMELVSVNVLFRLIAAGGLYQAPRKAGGTALVAAAVNEMAPAVSIYAYVLLEKTQ